MTPAPEEGSKPATLKMVFSVLPRRVCCWSQKKREKYFYIHIRSTRAEKKQLCADTALNLGVPQTES